MPDWLWFVWGFSHEEREDTYHWRQTEESETAFDWGHENKSTTLVERHRLTQSLRHINSYSHRFTVKGSCIHRRLLPSASGPQKHAVGWPLYLPASLSASGRVSSFYPKWPSHSLVPQTLYGFSIIRGNEKFCIYLRIYWNWIIKRMFLSNSLYSRETVKISNQTYPLSTHKRGAILVRITALRHSTWQLKALLVWQLPALLLLLSTF